MCAHEVRSEAHRTKDSGRRFEAFNLPFGFVARDALTSILLATLRSPSKATVATSVPLKTIRSEIRLCAAKGESRSLAVGTVGGG